MAPTSAAIKDAFPENDFIGISPSVDYLSLTINDCITLRNNAPAYPANYCLLC
ncbi:hypothetical protein ACXDG1_002133 [Klebsiella pneumoniae]|uniref:hypothetical protein n=1 Tax=Klebsiella pneumoniae TaxID=573 RepID=UPI00050C2C9B|nr:hypothetical protein [Klebsiella pneumoniae]